MYKIIRENLVFKGEKKKKEISLKCFKTIDMLRLRRTIYYCTRIDLKE